MFKQVGEEGYRECIAVELASWDQQVRVPFLGHLTKLLFDTFSQTEPTLKAVLQFVKVD